MEEVHLIRAKNLTFIARDKGPHIRYWPIFNKIYDQIGSQHVLLIVDAN